MVNKSCLFIREPEWRGHRQGTQHCLPQKVQSWAYETGSLTQRLRRHFGSFVNVTVLSQRWQTPFIGECRQLDLPAYRYALVREVMLHAGGVPLLLARTAIPQQTIKVAHRNLAHLGSRPLGEVIFSYPDLERISLELTLAEQNLWRPEILQQAKIHHPVWGRRTIYAIQQRPMLVSEFFMTAIVN